MKTLLILVDGMRPDSLSEIAEAQELMQKSSYTLNAQTVFPSVTLPCHMSLFHSVDPQRHGTTTNTYMPQVRPINGLCEVLKMAKKHCAFFYNWEELRDLSRPDSLGFGYFCSGHIHGYDKANAMVTDAAIRYISESDPDFSFLYLGWVDEAGHKYGWMTPEYMEAVESSWKEINRIIASLPEDYTVIVTADHGGHDRSHGTEMPEDMTIPVILYGKDFVPGKELNDVSIKDLAPTIAALLGSDADDDWEGKNLL